MLARGLTHLRAWAEVVRHLAEDGAKRSAVIILEANARSATPGTAVSSYWAQLVHAARASAARDEDILFLAQSPTNLRGSDSAAAYALSPRCCDLLSQRWDALVQGGVEEAEALVGRFVQSSGLRAARLPLLAPGACDAGACPRLAAAQSALPVPPLVPMKPRPDDVKIFIITLPHRGDRRVEPLVGSPAAVAAMRGAGFEVELIRASCYCERDVLEANGELRCYLEDQAGPAGRPHFARMRRYAGADAPVGAEEAERLRRAIDENYEGGAERLIDSMGGDVEGYVVDSNWPGATSCAISHARALLSAALDGYGGALVFEDDAVIPQQVAWRRGWCDGTCSGRVCHCASAWSACIEDAVELVRRAGPATLDVLYLGLGEAFEAPGPAEGLLPGEGGRLRWLSRALGSACPWPGASRERSEVGGITQIGYTWQTHAMLFTRPALEDLLAWPLSEVLWAQDEMIPHLYGRRPWNHRYLEALKAAGWRRRWVAGGPADEIDEGWVYQLETLTSDAQSDLGLGTAWQSSNFEEF